MRNNFEKKLAEQLDPRFAYEAVKIPYTLTHSYLPDWVDPTTREIIEGKGRFTSADRKKHLALKQQQPDWDVTIVFQNPDRPITKGSKTSYGGWCDKHGIKWRKA